MENANDSIRIGPAILFLPPSISIPQSVTPPNGKLRERPFAPDSISQVIELSAQKGHNNPMATASVKYHSCRRRFNWPANLLKAAPQITGDLSHLPTEILLEIFKYGDSLDRMCLALTCKRMLQVSSLVQIRIPVVRKHRFLPPSTCAEIFDLLRRIAPRDESGSIDRSMGICCDCLRRRTRRKQFWSPYERAWREMGVPSDHLEHALKSWYTDYSFQCPECWYREKYGHRVRNEGA